MEAIIDDPEVFDMIYKRDRKPLSLKLMLSIILIARVVNVLFATCSMWTISEDTRPFCEAIYFA